MYVHIYTHTCYARGIDVCVCVYVSNGMLPLFASVQIFCDLLGTMYSIKNSSPNKHKEQPILKSAIFSSLRSRNPLLFCLKKKKRGLILREIDRI